MSSVKTVWATPEKEDDNGTWCKADEVIAEQQEMAAELAVSQLRIAELEAALNRHAEKANKVDEAMKRKDRRVAELENLLSTEREYSVEVVQRNNRFAERIAELEALLKVRNAKIGPTVVRPEFHIDEDYE